MTFNVEEDKFSCASILGRKKESSDFCVVIVCLTDCNVVIIFFNVAIDSLIK